MVSRATWYNHGGKKRRIWTWRNSSQDAVPGTSTSVDVKELPPEDLEEEDRHSNIGHAFRLDLVS